jgi:sugar-specific transcriptional regulator TrmB
MDIRLLEEIGLTEGETKVYLALLRLGSTKTGPLAKEAEVSSSKVYKILDRLAKKGLAGHVVKGKIKYFTAMEPNRVLDYIDEKEKQLEEKRKLVEKIIPQLELERKAGKKTEAIIIEGFKGISNFFRNILDDLKTGEEYYVMGAGYVPTPAARPFYHQHHIKRAKKGIVVKMLANAEIKKNLEKTTYRNAEVRFLPQYLSSNMDITFYKDKALIFFTTKDPIGFLLISEEAVKGFKKYFDVLWKMAR